MQVEVGVENTEGADGGDVAVEKDASVDGGIVEGCRCRRRHGRWVQV